MFRKALAVLVVLALAGWGGWQGYGKIKAKLAAEQDKGKSRSRPPVPVETAAVVQGPIRDLRVLTGTLRANAQFNLAPKIAGRLESLTVDIGDPVRNGQEVARLESEEYVQRLQQALAELQVAKATVEQCSSSTEQARREFERARALREKQIASQSELDAAQSHLAICEANQKVAQAQVAQREAAVRAAEVQLSYTRIVALWENAAADAVRVVGERFVDEGAMLKAGDPIVSIVELHPIRAVVYVTEREYPAIRVGQAAEIACDAFPGRVFTGAIVRIAPLLKETSREALVEIDVANQDRALRPGMFVRVTLELARRDMATVIPVCAVVRRGDAQGVFLADAEARTAHFVPVELGIVSGDRAEVVSPSLTGAVVTLGQHLLDEGSPLLLPGAAGGGGERPQGGSPQGGQPRAGGGGQPPGGEPARRGAGGA